MGLEKSSINSSQEVLLDFPLFMYTGEEVGQGCGQIKGGSNAKNKKKVPEKKLSYFSVCGICFHLVCRNNSRHNQTPFQRILFTV